MLKVAILNKGSLTETATNMLRAAGYRRHTSPKDLTLVDSIHDVEFYCLRPHDIAVYVREGHLDIGITGRGMLLDSGAHTTEAMPLGFGGSRFRFVTPAGRSNDTATLAGKRIATSYPGLLGRWLGEHSIEANLVKLDGAMESVTRLGVIDMIADVVDTGTTLQRAGLEVLGELICASETILIRRDEDTEPRGFASLRAWLKSVLVAQNYLMMNYNVAESDLEATTALVSGASGPTVPRLAEPGWMTVRVLVPRRGAHLLMDRLFEMRVRGIIPTGLSAVGL